MRSDNAYEVEHRGFGAEGPIDGQEVVDTKGDEVAGDEGYLIWGEETHHIEYRCVYYGADTPDDAEADELLHLFPAEELLYSTYHPQSLTLILNL